MRQAQRARPLRVGHSRPVIELLKLVERVSSQLGPTFFEFRLIRATFDLVALLGSKVFGAFQLQVL